MKKFLMGSVSALCITLSMCAIWAAHTYYVSVTHPKVTSSYNNNSYTALVDDNKEAAIIGVEFQKYSAFENMHFKNWSGNLTDEAVDEYKAWSEERRQYLK